MLQAAYDEAMKAVFESMVATYNIPEGQFGFMTKRLQLGEGAAARTNGVPNPR